MATYQITHTTEYRYDSEVSSSYGEVHLLPRDLPTQRCRDASLTIDPRPQDLRYRTDFFGNRAGFFTVFTAHTHLSVTAASVVEVDGRGGDIPLFADQPWEVTRERLRALDDDAALEAAPFVFDSPLVAAAPALASLAEPSFTPGRPLMEAVADLSSRIHREFGYEPGSTSVHTSLAEVLETRAGVCQDFAHLLIGCLRSIGLAARYVSGYLETDPPPGREKLEGADVSHAWASVWVPGAGWVDVDPTNDRFVNDRHITTAWGRDYQDVSPLKGVIFTAGAEHELKVSVHVQRVE